MAVLYSKLGGCLGDTTKLGPLGRTYLCTWVKGLLDKLMTHLGLGSSMEDPWTPIRWEVVASCGVALLAWGVGLFPWEAWKAWEALSLAECLTTYLPAWGETKPVGVFSHLGRTFPRRNVFRGGTSFLGNSAVPGKGVLACLPAWEEPKF